MRVLTEDLNAKLKEKEKALEECSQDNKILLKELDEREKVFHKLKMDYEKKQKALQQFISNIND